MKKRSNWKKLIPVIAMLLVSAITLSTSTYAWFTMSRVVTATGMSMNVIMPSGIEISNNNTAYAATAAASAADIANTASKKLMPASTVNGINFFAAEVIDASYAPDANTNFIAADTQLTSTTDGYYADFTFWLRTTVGSSNPVDITISQAQTIITDGTGTSNEAARFAILDASGASPAVFAGKNAIYGSDVDYFTGLAPIASAGKGVQAGTAITANSDNTLFTLAANGGTPQKIVIRVWLEGQDLECTNPTAAGMTFGLTVAFRDAALTDAAYL